MSENISAEAVHRDGLSFEPEYLSYTLEVPAESQAVHFFDNPLVEFSLECDSMKGNAKYVTEAVYRGGGGSGWAVRVPSDKSIGTRFQVDRDATYALSCIVDPAEDNPASLYVDGKKLSEIKGADGLHAFAYPVSARVRLKPGKHSLAIKFGEGGGLADRVIVTTDTDLAGFAYSFVDPNADQRW